MARMAAGTEKQSSNKHHSSGGGGERKHHHHHHHNNRESRDTTATSHHHSQQHHQEQTQNGTHIDIRGYPYKGGRDRWDPKVKKINDNLNYKCRHPGRRSDSVLSSSSDIRFTRKNLGENEKCGCALIAGFLAALLLAGAIIYIGYTYLRPDLLPDKIYRAKFKVIDGDTWSNDLADQNSVAFQQKARDYRERINLLLRRSDLKESYEGSEILALDGNDDDMADANKLIIHFIVHFDPYRGLSSVADLVSIFNEEFVSSTSRYFADLKVDAGSLEFTEVTGLLEDLPGGTSSAPLGIDDNDTNVSTTESPPRNCEPVGLEYCRSVGYNMTTYPNLLGHWSLEEVHLEVIKFRELVDGECYRQAFDFICRLLQPPCLDYPPLEPNVGLVCRSYCQSFWNGCHERLPAKFKKFFDCERFPESTGVNSCTPAPGCAAEMQHSSLSGRMCDGVADCPDLSDESQCSYCPSNSLHCGRGRACIAKRARCDGKVDCPDGTDEQDCLAIAPLVSKVINPLTPHRKQFFDEGFATFTEKGATGKLCAEGMSTERENTIRETVAESLCKALGYDRHVLAEVRSDTEPGTSYVRVLDPKATEISFIRTECKSKEALFVKCAHLECGIQSVYGGSRVSLTKMSASGDWPWHVALFRSDVHVCDGTLVAENWVLTTEGCFQGQSKATWLAVFGTNRLDSSPPWIQRRRIIGMIKSPVEGSTAALIRLESPIVYSDFVRPICLSDEMSEVFRRVQQSAAKPNQIAKRRDSPYAEKLEVTQASVATTPWPDVKKPMKLKENNDFFESPILEFGHSHDPLAEKEFNVDFTDDSERIPRAEALFQAKPTLEYPLPKEPPQTSVFKKGQFSQPHLTVAHYANAAAQQVINERQTAHQWVNCNTLGWTRTKNQLQRVQLKIGEMTACENVSIATVNSMCAEAVYHKQDCSEEEFAGSPVICLLPDNRRWAIIGVASWRIACAPTGIERPRMYDKLTSNALWIRDTINSV